jgi:hypothetical protein
MWQQDVCLSSNKGQSTDGTPAIQGISPDRARSRNKVGEGDRHATNPTAGSEQI